VKKKRGGGRGSGYTYGVCSDLGGVLRAVSSRLRSWAVFLRRQVSGFEMGRREHTIDGVMAIDRVCDVLCGGGASLPLASCCLLSSPSSCLHYAVLNISRVASLGFKLLLLLLLRLLLLGFMPRRLHLTSCWSTFDACHLRESAVAFMGALDCGLGGMGSVAVVVVNEMVVGGRKMFDVAMQTTVSGMCQATRPYRVLICTLY